MSSMNEVSETRVERRKKRTRTALMQAAAELLIEKGYEHTSVQAIADRADVGRATFYMHFVDKEDILWQMLYEHSLVVTQMTNEALVHETFPRREYLSWRMFFERTQAAKAVTNALFAGKGSLELYRKLLAFVTQLHQDNLAAQRYSSGLDLPPEVLAPFAAGALMNVAAWWLTTPNDYSAEQMADMFYHMIFHVPPSDEVKYGAKTDA